MPKIDLDAIIRRDSLAADTWFKGPASSTANAMRDRRALLVFVDELQAEIARLEALVYVPGHWECPKCKLYLVSANLHAKSGNFSPNNEPQQCVNCCGGMWRVTERQAGNTLIENYDKVVEQKNQQIASLSKLLLETQGDKSKPCGRNLGDPPADCDAPFCGCNPAWSEAIVMLEEAGFIIDQSGAGKKCAHNNQLQGERGPPYCAECGNEVPS